MPRDNSEIPESSPEAATSLDLEHIHNTCKHQVLQSARKKGTVITAPVVSAVEEILVKYRHAVDVTHKNELEERYAKLVADVAAEDEAISRAQSQVARISHDMQKTIVALHAELTRLIKAEGEHVPGFTVVLNEAVNDEKRVLAELAGPALLDA